MSKSKYPVRKEDFRRLQNGGPSGRVQVRRDVFVCFRGRWEWYRIGRDGIEAFQCFVTEPRQILALDNAAFGGWVTPFPRLQQPEIDAYFSARENARRSRVLELEAEGMGEFRPARCDARSFYDRPRIAI